MKASTPALEALLTSGRFVFADLWTFTLYGGVVVRWSGVQTPVVANGQTWVVGPPIKRGPIDEKRGLEVPTLQATFMANGGDLIAGAPLIPFIKNRGLDGAILRLDCAFMANWGLPAVGTVLRFLGPVTSIDQIGGASAQMTASGWTNLLNINMPTNLYQAGCLHTVYDAGCGLDPNAFSATGSVTAVADPTQNTFSTSLSGVPNDYSQGKLVFTTGANAGQPRAVKSYDGAGNFVLISPLGTAPQPGDQFTAYKGCDNTLATCRAKFNNAGPGLPRRFKGTPFIPVPETAIG